MSNQKTRISRSNKHFYFSKTFGHVTDLVVALNLRRCKQFPIWTHWSTTGTLTKQQNNLLGQTVCKFPEMRVCKCRESQPLGCRDIQNDVCHELSQLPQGPYYSTAQPLCESCKMTRARSERPPAKPEKCKEMHETCMSKKKNSFF